MNGQLLRNSFLFKPQCETFTAFANAPIHAVVDEKIGETDETSRSHVSKFKNVSFKNETVSNWN